MRDMTKEEIEESRVNLKLIITTLADAGAMMGKPTDDVEAVRAIGPLAIDKLCEMAMKGLARPEANAIDQLAEHGTLTISPDRVIYEPRNHPKPKHEGNRVEWHYVLRSTPDTRRAAIADCLRRLNDPEPQSSEQPK